MQIEAFDSQQPRAHELAMKLRELKKPPHFISPYTITSKKSAAALFRSVCKIGGEEGWLHANWMWRIRGLIDTLFLGVGISRGRRSSTSLRVNDAVDFWRVEEIVQDRRLLLRAEMKLPGKAWLEFKISSQDEGNRLTATPYFEPKGITGKIYWYIFLPFHTIIFKNLIKKIDARS